MGLRNSFRAAIAAHVAEGHTVTQTNKLLSRLCEAAAAEAPATPATRTPRKRLAPATEAATASNGSAAKEPARTSRRGRPAAATTNS